MSEQEVQRRWRQLFTGTELTVNTIEKAGALLEQLRMESPLRHRLAVELEELRERAVEDVAK
jgi:hypothetical protein